jgi:hypothetical protein
LSCFCHNSWSAHLACCTCYALKDFAHEPALWWITIMRVVANCWSCDQTYEVHRYTQRFRQNQELQAGTCCQGYRSLG